MSVKKVSVTLCIVLMALAFSSCNMVQKSRDENIIFDIPYLPPLCVEIPDSQKGFVDVLEGKLYYEWEGNGIPLVLINGGPGGTHQCFHPYFSRLKDVARIIYYDQRGTGKSSKDDTGKTYTIAQAVEDLESLRKALKIDRWAVFGWSYGGLLAQCYALSYPKQCSGLILCAATPGIPSNKVNPEREKLFVSQAEQDAIDTIVEMTRNGRLTTAQCIYNTLLAGGWKLQWYHKPSKEEIVRRALYGWTPGTSLLEQLLRPEVYKVNLLGKFDDCQIPTLILEAKWDLLWQDPDRGEDMRKNHPHAQFEMLEKSGHTMFADEPEKFFSLVRIFLRQSKLR